MESHPSKPWWALAVVVCATAVLAYYPHIDYPYPLHVDEWHHIYEASRLAQGEYGLHSLASFEVGYHVFLALLLKLGVNLVLSYKYLPALFAAASALSAFAFVYRISGSFRAGLFSVLFLASLPSNVNLMGMWFATPLTFSIPLIYLALYLFWAGFEDRDTKALIGAVLALMVCLLSYPPSAFLIIIVITAYALLNHDRIGLGRNSAKVLAGSVTALAAVSAAFVLILGKGLGWFAEKLMFPQGWTPLEPGLASNSQGYTILGYWVLVSPYLMPILFGVVPFALALTGLYVCLGRRQTLMLPVWLIYSLATIFVFVNLHFSPLIPYQRMAYFCLLCLAPLAGIGLDASLDYAQKAFKGWNRYASAAAIVIVLYLTFAGYGHPVKGMELYHLIDDADYAAAVFLKGQPQGTVLAIPKTASALPAITSKEVVADLIFVAGEAERKDSSDFFMTDCSGKKTIADRNKLAYVFSQTRFDCPGFSLLYSDGRYVYSVT